MKLTQARLKELLHYDSKTGIFKRLKTTSSNAKKGDIAGGISKSDGYRYVRINGKLYKAARLAWLCMEGYFPENEVDHQNRIRRDDRWENLRHVSKQCNARNCNLSKNNKSGINGVSWDKRNQKWVAQIMISGKNINLGLFRSKLNATRVRWEAEKKYDFPNCNTTSTAYLYLKEREKLWP